MKILNIGILAHVDAGKTSLTERLLFDVGVIHEVGSVDAGSTQTDSMEMERQRGITIQSAVVSFTIDDLKVNLIDTPGHSDFISEVERAVRVLDGAVLVVSAVEGVQSQTRVLMRTLTRLGIPVLLFVNKVDRMGARYDELLADIRAKLTPHGIAMSSVSELGTRKVRVEPRRFDDPEFRTELAELLTEHNDSFLASYLAGESQLTEKDYQEELAAQVGQSRAHPVFFGSAIAGEGVGDLIRGIRNLLPAGSGNGTGRTSGTVFKIERGPAGEKIAYVRMYGGQLGAREQITCYRRGQHGTVQEYPGRVTAVRVFEQGAVRNETRVAAGDIAKLWGLKDSRIGDQIGSPDELPAQSFFAPPSLETVIRAKDQRQEPALYAALQKLTEQDPFISTRRDSSGPDGPRISVRLYGEVQKEVIEATLANDFGVDVVFEQTQPIYIEKPLGTGAAVEAIDRRTTRYFWATIGLRVEPGPPDSGITYRLGVELGSLPRAFHHAIEETVYQTLRQGLRGWEVTDCVVTLTHSGYAPPVSTAADFRQLTPLLLMDALKQAGTRVYRPINRFELETPAATLSQVLLKLVEAAAVPGEPVLAGSIYRLAGTIPASRVHEIERQLPALTQGEGVFLSQFEGYQPVAGEPPARPRTDGNPLDRKEYLLHVLKKM